MSRYTKTYRAWIRITAMVVVCLFTVNSVALAAGPGGLRVSKETIADGSHLQVYTSLDKAGFKEKFKAMTVLLSHEVINTFIKERIERILDIRGKKGLMQKYINVAGQEVIVTAIPGLLRETGQFAHVGLGRHHGIPAIYVDSEFYEDKDVLQHEMDEVRLWEEFRKNELGINREEMRQWILEHSEEAKRKAKEFHEKAHSMNPLYKKYAEKIDFDFAYIQSLLTKIALNGGALTDEESGDVNIAAKTSGVPDDEADEKLMELQRRDIEKHLNSFHKFMQGYVSSHVPRAGTLRKQFVLTSREKKICAEDISKFLPYFEGIGKGGKRVRLSKEDLEALLTGKKQYYEIPKLAMSGKSGPGPIERAFFMSALNNYVDMVGDVYVEPGGIHAGEVDYVISKLESITGVRYTDVIQEFMQNYLEKAGLDGDLIPILQDDMRVGSIVRGLISKRPLLFIRSKDSFGYLEMTLKALADLNLGEVVSVPLTPFSDRNQLIGGKMPDGKRKHGQKKQPFTYHENVIPRLVEYARANPGKPVYLVLDNIDSVSDETRVMLNELIRTGRLNIPELGKEIILPQNLHVIATMSSDARIKDEAFFDRFVRKRQLKLSLAEVLLDAEKPLDVKRGIFQLRSLDRELDEKIKKINKAMDGYYQQLELENVLKFKSQIARRKKKDLKEEVKRLEPVLQGIIKELHDKIFKMMESMGLDPNEIDPAVLKKIYLHYDEVGSKILERAALFFTKRGFDPTQINYEFPVFDNSPFDRLLNHVYTGPTLINRRFTNVLESIYREGEFTDSMGRKLLSDRPLSRGDILRLVLCIRGRAAEKKASDEYLERIAKEELYCILREKLQGSDREFRDAEKILVSELDTMFNPDDIIVTSPAYEDAVKKLRKYMHDMSISTGTGDEIRKKCDAVEGALENAQNAKDEYFHALRSGAPESEVREKNEKFANECEIFNNLQALFDTDLREIKELIQIVFTDILAVVTTATVSLRPEAIEKYKREYEEKQRKLNFFSRYKPLTYSFDPQKHLFTVEGVSIKIKDSITDEKSLFRETGLILDTPTIKMLSAIFRSYKYGNRMLVLSGATGIGKTFTLEAFAKMIDAEFYGEPTHKGSDIYKLIGAVKSDEDGDFYLDRDVPFLKAIAKSEDGEDHRSVVALSELNAKVARDGSAALAWWLAGLAREDDPILLTEHPRPPPDDGRPFEAIDVNKGCFIGIDINPKEGGYTSRGTLPGAVSELVPTVNLDGGLSGEDVIKFVRMHLEEKMAPGIDRTLALSHALDVISDIYVRIQEMIDERIIAKSRKDILSKRDLKRICDDIAAFYLEDGVIEALKKALDNNLLVRFSGNDRKMVDGVFKDFIRVMEEKIKRGEPGAAVAGHTGHGEYEISPLEDIAQEGRGSSPDLINKAVNLKAIPPLHQLDPLNYPYIFREDEDAEIVSEDFDAEELEYILKGGEKGFFSISYLPDGRILTSDHDFTVRIWDLETKKVYKTNKGCQYLSSDVLPDGRVVLGTNMGDVLVWDVDNKKAKALRHDLITHGRGKEVNKVTALSDGRIVAVYSDNMGGENPKIAVWSLTSEKVEVQVVAEFRKRVRSIAKLPDDRIVFGLENHEGDSYPTVIIWDFNKRECTEIKHPGLKGAWAVSGFPDDPNKIVSGHTDGSVWIWDISRSGVVNYHNINVHDPSHGNIRAIIGLEGGRVVSAGNDKTIRMIYPTDSSTEMSKVQTMQIHDGFVEVLARDPYTRDRFVSGGSDGTARVWHLPKPEKPKRDVKLVPEPLEKEEADFTPAPPVLLFQNAIKGKSWIYGEGDLIISIGASTKKVEPLRPEVDPNDEIIVENNPDMQELENTLKGHPGSVREVAILPDGRIASGGRDSTIRIWDLKAGKVTTLKGHPGTGFSGTIGSITSLPDGRIVSAGYDKTIKIWDLAKQEVITLEGHMDEVRSVAILPDGRIVSGSKDGRIKIWDLEKSETFTWTAHSGSVDSVAVLPDGRIASGGFDRKVKIWDLETDKVATLEGHSDGVWSVTSLPDGRIISSSMDKTVKIWNIKKGKVTTLKGHSDSVDSVAVLPDGRIVSASRDKTIKIWDLETDKVVTVEGHSQPVLSVATLTDGRIVSGSHDKTIKIWNVPGTEELLEAEEERKKKQKETTGRDVEVSAIKAAVEADRPCLAFYNVESNYMDIVEDIVRDRGAELEEILIKDYTDEYELIGGYIPKDRDLTIKQAMNIILTSQVDDVVQAWNALHSFQRTEDNIDHAVSGARERELVGLAKALLSKREGRGLTVGLQWQDGILPRLIKQQARSKKELVLILNTYHNMRPEVAVMLNSFLQEGLLYLPSQKEPLVRPSNLRFIALANEEAQIPMSLAEQARWTKVALSLDEIEEIKTRVRRAAREAMMGAVSIEEMPKWLDQIEQFTLFQVHGYAKSLTGGRKDIRFFFNEAVYLAKEIGEVIAKDRTPGAAKKIHKLVRSIYGVKLDTKEKKLLYDQTLSFMNQTFEFGLAVSKTPSNEEIWKKAKPIDPVNIEKTIVSLEEKPVIDDGTGADEVNWTRTFNYEPSIGDVSEEQIITTGTRAPIAPKKNLIPDFGDKVSVETIGSHKGIAYSGTVLPSSGAQSEGLILTGEDKGVIHIWDKKNKQDYDFIAHGGQVMAIAPLSEDSFISISQKEFGRDDTRGEISFWKINRQGGVIKNVTKVRSKFIQTPLRSVAVLPDGRIAAGSERGMLLLLDFKTDPSLIKARILGIPGMGPVYGVKVLPDGRIVTAGTDMRIWDVSDEENIKSTEIPGINSGLARLSLLSPTKVAAGSFDGTVKVVDFTDIKNTKVTSFKCHTFKSDSPDYTVAVTTFEGNDNIVASTSINGTVKMIDVENSRVLELDDGEDNLTYVTLTSEDGKVITAGGFVRKVKIWDVPIPVKRAEPDVYLDPKPLEKKEGRFTLEEVGAFNKNTETVKGNRRSFTLIKSPTNKPMPNTDQTKEELLEHLIDHEDGVIGISELPDGRVVTASKDRKIKIWDLKTRDVMEIQAPRGDNIPIHSLTVLPDGRIVTGSAVGFVQIWDISTGEVLTFRTFSSTPVVAITALPDGRIAASGIQTGYRVIKIIDPAKEKDNFEVFMPDLSNDGRIIGDMRSIAVLNNGNVAFCEDSRDGVKVFDRATNKILLLKGQGELANNNEYVGTVKMLSDGRLASGGNGIMRIWEFGDKALRVTRAALPKKDDGKKHSPLVCIAELEKDRFVSGDRFGDVRIWDLEDEVFFTTSGHLHGKAKPNSVLSVCKLSGGRFATACIDGNASVWQAPSFSPEDKQKRTKKKITTKDGKVNIDGVTYPVANEGLVEKDEEELLIDVDPLVEAERSMLLAWKNQLISILIGPPGAGKTEMASDLAKRVGLPYHVFSMRKGIDLTDWIGRFYQDEYGDFVITTKPYVGDDGKLHYNEPLLEYMANGGVFIVDEGALGKDAEKMLQWLTTIAQGKRKIKITEHPSKKPIEIDLSEHFHVVITTNPIGKTALRRPIPLEVLANSQVINVSGEFSKGDLVGILSPIVTKSEEFMSLYKKSEEGLDYHVSRACVRLIEAHKSIKKAIGKDIAKGVESLKKDRYFISLRELKNFAKDFIRFLPDIQGEAAPENLAYEASYLINYVFMFDKRDLETLKSWTTGGHYHWDRLMETPIKDDGEHIELSGIRMKKGKIKDQFHRVREEDIAWTEGIKTEEYALRALFLSMATGRPVMTLNEPGARDRVILDKLASTLNHELYVNACNPDQTVVDILGGLFPILKGETDGGRLLMPKDGFLTRQLKADAEGNKILYLKNIDALDEDVRSALSNFLLKGYIEVKGNNGKMIRLEMPEGIRIVASVSVASNADFSSAFYNRFNRVRIGPVSHSPEKIQPSVTPTTNEAEGVLTAELQGILWKLKLGGPSNQHIRLHGIQELSNYLDDHVVKSEEIIDDVIEVLVEASALSELEDSSSDLYKKEKVEAFCLLKKIAEKAGMDKSQIMKLTVTMSSADEMKDENKKKKAKDEFFALIGTAPKAAPPAAAFIGAELVRLKDPNPKVREEAINFLIGKCCEEDNKSAVLTEKVLDAVIEACKAEDVEVNKDLLFGFLSSAAKAAGANQAVCDNLIYHIRDVIELGRTHSGLRRHRLVLEDYKKELYDQIGIKSAGSARGRPCRELLTPYVAQLALLKDTDPARREEAIHQIHKYWSSGLGYNKDVVNALVDMLTDSDNKVVLAAEKTLRDFAVWLVPVEGDWLVLTNVMKVIHEHLEDEDLKIKNPKLYEEAREMLHTYLRTADHWFRNIPLSLEEKGLSELERMLIGLYGVPEKAALTIRGLYEKIKVFNDQGRWPSNKRYDFTVKDALLLGSYVRNAIITKKARGEKVDVAKIVSEEAYTLYGEALEGEADAIGLSDKLYFKKYVLNIVSRHEDVVEADPFVTLDKDGLIADVAGVPVSPNREKAASPRNVEPMYRLLYVPTIVRTMRAILRGWQPVQTKTGRSAPGVVSLMGRTGVAKTSLGLNLARVLGLDSYVFPTYAQARETDLTMDVAVEGGEYIKKVKEFLNKVRQGDCILIVDEANIRSRLMYGIISELAAGKTRITVEFPGEKEQKIKVGENVFVMLTMNPKKEFGGRQKLPSIVMDDVVKIWVGGNYTEEEISLITKSFLGIYTEELKNLNINRDLLPRPEAGGSVVLTPMMMTTGEYALMRQTERRLYRETGEGQQMEEAMDDEFIQRRLKMVQDGVMALSHVKLNDIVVGPKWSYTIVHDKNDKSKIRGRYVTIGAADLAKKVPQEEEMGHIDHLIAIIIHEVRHQKFTVMGGDLDKAIDERAVDMSDETAEAIKKANESPMYHDLLNALEDGRIDYIKLDELPGENDYLKKWSEREFGSKPTKEQIEKQVELAEFQPHIAFSNELFHYIYTGRFTEAFRRYPEKLRDALKKAKGWALRAARRKRPKQSRVLPVSDEDREDIVRCQLNSLIIIAEHILPEYTKFVQESIDNIAEKLRQGGVSVSSGGEGLPVDVNLLPDDVKKMLEEQMQQNSMVQEKNPFSQGAPDVQSQTTGAEPDGTESGGDKDTEGKPAQVKPGEDKSAEGEAAQGKPGEGGQGQQDGQDQQGQQDGQAQGGQGQQDEQDQAGQGAQGMQPLMPDEEPMQPGQREAELQGQGENIEQSLSDRLDDIREKEPFVFNLSRVDPIVMMMSEGLLDVLLEDAEDDHIWASSGRGDEIDFRRFIQGHPKPFKRRVEGERIKKTAFEMCIDLSASMDDQWQGAGLKQSVMSAAALFINTMNPLEEEMDEIEYSLTGFHGGFVPFKDFGRPLVNGDLNKKLGELDGLYAAGDSTDLTQAIKKIVAKLKDKEGLKIATLITDAYDNMNVGEKNGKMKAVGPLAQAIKEAEDSGIILVGIGIGEAASNCVEIFKHHAKISDFDQIPELFIKIIEGHTISDGLPLGDLVKEFGIIGDRSNRREFMRQVDSRMRGRKRSDRKKRRVEEAAEAVEAEEAGQEAMEGREKPDDGGDDTATSSTNRTGADMDMANLITGPSSGIAAAGSGSRKTDFAEGFKESPEALSDARDVMDLLNNVVPPQFEEGRKYEIHYDVSRLSAEQAAIVKEYIRCLKIRVKDPGNIKARPYSRARSSKKDTGSRKSLISVICTGKEFRGEGHVDIELPKNQRIEETLLRVPIMMNIAIASSNIPDKLTDKDVESYSSIIRFIQSQFRLITGKDMVLPGTTFELAKALKWIVLELPEASKKSYSEIETYNELARKALISV